MPALRWTTVDRPPETAGVCTIFAARLPLRSYRHLPRLVWFAGRVRGQLRLAQGLLGFAFALRVQDKTLWTVSAWSHRTHLARFGRTAPHRTARYALRGAMLPSTLVVWTCPVRRLPVPWHEVQARVEAVGNETPPTSAR